MTARAHQAWKDAWYSFRALIWRKVGDPGWCWLSVALQRYRQKETKVLDALQTEFDDLSWWKQWQAWNEQYEELLPSSDDFRNVRAASPLPSELPMPPSEPDNIWPRTEDLWASGDEMLSLGGAAIRVALARGRATRELRGDTF